MTKTKSKKRRLPKPVTAWANYHRGVLQAVCVVDYINGLSRDDLWCGPGHDVVRIRITPIAAEPKRRAKR